MRLAFLHYHLRPGGVTRVIENAVAAVGQKAECVVLTGEPYTGTGLPATEVVEGLGYRETPDGLDGATLGQRILAAATNALGGAPDLWHVHNHSLGKNVVFPAALHYLLDEGAKVLLQIHDFAEDGRPANYRAQRSLYPSADTFAQALFPAAPQIHYATLNARDDSILERAGIPRRQRRLLPNAISVPDLPEMKAAQPFALSKRYFLYPTRAIRRKNIGELVLHAAVARTAHRDVIFASTLAPENPVWQPIYDSWIRFAREQNLPVAFGVGEDPASSFPALIRGAEALVTTSVAEGFGLAFLEPFLFGKDVGGRDLPEITADFTAHGVSLENLYPTLPVPLDPPAINLLRSKLATGLAAAFEAYGQTPPPDAAESAFEFIHSPEGYDFGRLDERLQCLAIQRVLEKGPPESLLCRFPQARGEAAITENRRAVESAYGLAAYGKKLLAAYEAILQSGAGIIGAHDADALLTAFLDPARFNLLRT